MRTGKVRGLSFLVSVTLVTGCATIMNQTKQNIGISSVPTGASVTINNVSHGKTPVVAKLARKKHHFVKIEMSGYKPYETALTRKVSGWVWGNIAIGGLIGLAIDAISGGMYKLTPEQIVAELRNEGQTSQLQEDSLYIAVVLSPKADWEKIGQLEPAI